MPVTIPSIDMIEIGAGGGSIARVDDLGLLKVGPRQRRLGAGPGLLRPRRHVADGHRRRPGAGPARCRQFPRRRHEARPQGRRSGGRPARRRARPVADAGGAAASSASSPSPWRRRRAPTPPTAASITAACRCSPSAARGRCMPARSAALLQSSEVILPPQASVLSAFGTLVTPVRLDLVRSALGPRRRAGLGARRPHPGRDGRRGDARRLREAGCAEDSVTLIFGADLRYVGQQNEVTVAFDDDPRGHHDAARIVGVFEPPT